MVIEPDKNLIEYFKRCGELDCHSDDFTEDGEWHYIQSDIEKNIFLIKDLDEMGLLTDKVKVCDCGIGLGTIMFDFYLQSLKIDKEFEFTGIEKNKRYINFLKSNLIDMWCDNLELIHSDIRDCDYSNYDFIYMYQPFKRSDLAMQFYHKIINEAKPGCLIFGIDHFNVINYGTSELIKDFNKLERIHCGEWHLLRKI